MSSVIYGSFGNTLTAGTAVASTSGTAIDFTGIPSWVKRITVMFSVVSTNGTSNTLVQIGDAGGIETTGYTSGVSQSNNTIVTSSTAGFIVSSGQSAASTYSGLITISLIGSNQWILSGVLFNPVGATHPSAGNKTLSDVLDRIRITTVNGTDTFDAGSINILYE